MRLRLVNMLVAAMLALGATAQAQSGTEPARSERFIGVDQFSAGGSLRLHAPVSGDLFAFGGNVDVEGAVGGDTVLAGGNVRIGAPVAQSVYAAGGQLVIGAPIGRNARIAGGQVDIDRRAQIGGNVLVAGGQVTIAGRVKGSVRAGGGNVVIDGPVDGDVVSTAGRIELGPGARIGGRLRYASRDEIDRHPQAQVLGGIERLQLTARAPAESPSPAIVQGAGWGWTLGLVALAALLSATLIEPTRCVAATLRQRPATSLLIGFIVLVCGPVAAVMLLFSVVGIPLALLVVVLYLAMLLLGYVGSGIAVGEWALQRLAAARAAQRAARALAAAAGMLAIALLAMLPWAGAVIVFVALIAGLGALALQLDRRAISP